LTTKLTTTRVDPDRRAASRDAFVVATEALMADVAAEEAARILAEQDELAREYLELERVAGILHIGMTKLRRLIRTGQIASFQPGKKILVPRTEVIRYAEGLLAGRR
jgi:excisionase family DNA binding protein